METSGYSETPLAKKLGFKNGFKVRLVNVPHYYPELFVDLPADLLFLDKLTIKKYLIHYFTTKTEELERDILSLKNEIESNGIIWISWPKKSSKVPTNITEDTIRNLALANGLVDVKVCAIDPIWSGLKLVIPLKYRNTRETDISNQ